jgi:uncharacterized membrane protein
MMMGVLIIFVIGILVRTWWHGVGQSMLSQRDDTVSRDALELAEVRYAQGEISRDEFLDMVDDLSLADADFEPKRKRGEW